jgi:hypothetical protein
VPGYRIRIRNTAGQTVPLCCRYSLRSFKFLITDPKQASASFKIWGTGTVLFCTFDDVYFQAPPEGGRTLPVQLCDGIPPAGDSVRSSQDKGRHPSRSKLSVAFFSILVYMPW